MITRRRFLAISAFTSAAAITGQYVTAPAINEWHGFLMGAEVSIKISGNKQQAENAIVTAVDEIKNLEALFSIYNPASQLSRLNHEGKLLSSTPFNRLMDEVDFIHAKSFGLFDPTVQPLFVGKENYNLGWQNVARNGHHIHFKKPHMAMTLNGIAQGYITDRVSEILYGAGLTDVLVNMGEFRAGKTAQTIGIANLKNEIIQEISLKENAVATSAPQSFILKNGQNHIIAPNQKIARQQPPLHWKTISVVAKAATHADGFSTALALTKNTELAESLLREGHIEQVILEDLKGKIITI